LVPTGGIILLDVKMALGRYWWCYVAWGLTWQFVAGGDVIKLVIEMAVVRYWWCYVAWCWDGSYSLVVMLCGLMLRWQLFACG